MPLPSVVLNVKSSLSIECHLSEPEIYIIFGSRCESGWPLL